LCSLVLKISAYVTIRNQAISVPQIKINKLRDDAPQNVKFPDKDIV
jgi:hypothetical protein